MSYNFLFEHLILDNFSSKKVLMGHSRLLWNSYNKPFGYCFVNKWCLFSLNFAYFSFKKAVFFIFRLFATGRGHFAFFVNGLPFIQNRFFLSKFSGSFFNEKTRSRSIVRWVPGLLTNINHVLAHMYMMLGSKKYMMYNRSGFKEILVLVKKRGKRRRRVIQFRFPSVIIFLSSAGYHCSAIRESSIAGIPSVGVVDSDSSFFGLSFPVSGNDDSLLPIILYLNIFSESIFRGIAKNLFTERIFIERKLMRKVKRRSFIHRRKYSKMLFRPLYKNLRLCSYHLFRNRFLTNISQFYRFDIFSKFLKSVSRLRFLSLILKKKNPKFLVL